MRALAYLFPTFPVLHQTFTLGEVLGLEAAGYELDLVSLKRSGDWPQQPEARRLVDRTLYCPPLFSVAMGSAFLRALFRRPRRCLGLFVDVVRAWRVRVPDRSGVAEDVETTMGWWEKLRGVYHCNRWVYLAKSLTMVPFALYVAEVLERRGVRHVHAHWATYPTTVAWLIRRWAGIPYSFTAHAYDIHMVQQMLATKIEDAEFVVTCAEANRSFLRRTCTTPAADRIYLNYHGTDLDRFSAREREGTGGGRLRIVACGSLEEYKGFHYLIEAVGRLVSRGVDASCELAGDGPQRPVLEQRARDLGLQDRVTFHGFVDQRALAGIYARADAFAMPSVCLGRYGKQDVIPNVLAEAMACGVPVVASAIAGIPELVEDECTGLLVPERDPLALADALERIGRDPQLARRLASGALDKVRRVWDRSRNLEQLGAILDAHVGGGLTADAA